VREEAGGAAASEEGMSDPQKHPIIGRGGKAKKQATMAADAWHLRLKTAGLPPGGLLWLWRAVVCL
jgi:hypothetical protein